LYNIVIMQETPRYPWSGVITDEMAQEALLPQLFGPLTEEELTLLGAQSEVISHLLPIICASAAVRTARRKSHDASSTMRLVRMVSEIDKTVNWDGLFDKLNILFRARYEAPSTRNNINNLQLDGDKYISS